MLESYSLGIGPIPSRKKDTPSSNLGQNQGTNKWTDELDDYKTEEGFLFPD